MLTREQIAERLNISTEVLRRTVETKPGFPVPLRLSRKTVLWVESEFEAWLSRELRKRATATA